MAWADYWKRHVDAADATERQVASAWKRAVAVVFLWERWFRRSVVMRAMDLPVVRGGWIDSSSRDSLWKFRARVRSDAEFANAMVRRQLGIGTRDEVARITERRGLPAGFVKDQLDRAAARVPSAAILDRDIPPDGDRVVVPRGKGKAGVILPKTITPAMLREIERELERLPETGGIIEDRWEVGYDALTNMSRTLGYEFRRVTETVVRMTGRHSRRDALVAYLDGGRGGRPWQVNRNNWMLSSTAHLRAMHRRRAIDSGIREGVTHYRLDVPKSRLGDLGKGGLLAQHVWRTRTLPEWQSIHDKINRGRLSASSFDTLGLHHGDFSYVVPVPGIYMTSALKQGRRLRAALAAGLIASTAIGGE